MDKYIKTKIEKLVKSMQKSVKKVKEENVIKDVLDADRIAEVSPDDIAANKTGTLNKGKEKDLEKCSDDPDCECNEEDNIKKGEDFITDILSKFEVISNAYLKKQEGTKLKDSMVNHALQDKKTGIPKIDASISDAKGQGRMALPEERPKKQAPGKSGPAGVSSKDKAGMGRARKRMESSSEHMKKPVKNKRMVSRNELKALKASKMKRANASKSKTLPLAASEGKK